MGDDHPPVSHEADTDVYSTEFDPRETRPFLALVALFDAATDEEETPPPVLYDFIDCEALERLITWSEGNQQAQTLTVEYATDRLALTVRCVDGSVRMELRRLS